MKLFLKSKKLRPHTTREYTNTDLSKKKNPLLKLKNLL